MNDGEALLRLDDVHAFYGLSHVLQGVSLRVPRGGIVSLIGRNGAGKTTTLKSVLGLVKAPRGRIALGGESIAGLPPHQIARRGIALVPEERRIFSALTVAENILLSAGGRKDAIPEALEWFPALGDYLRRSGDRLSGGEQQMLAIARALVARPQLMLIDEPLEGLAPIIAERIEQALAALRGKITALHRRPEPQVADAGRRASLRDGPRPDRVCGRLGGACAESAADRAVSRDCRMSWAEHRQPDAARA